MVERFRLAQVLTKEAALSVVLADSMMENEESEDFEYECIYKWREGDNLAQAGRGRRQRSYETFSSVSPNLS